MANSTKRDIVQKLRREEQMAIRATRFMAKPTTIRQTKRTRFIAISGAVLLAVLAILRFTVFEPAFEPPVTDLAPRSPTPAPSVASASPKPLSIEELENQAIINGPHRGSLKH